MTYLRASSLVVALALAGGTAAAYAQTGAAQSNSTAGGSTMSPAGGTSTDATATGTGGHRRQWRLDGQRPGRHP